MYLIYPKKQDPQKPLLIILGFIYGLMLSNVQLDMIEFFKLIFIIFTFDFLAYQARYQINDIRGLKEDKEAGCKNRLLSDDTNNPGHVIKISFIIAVIRMLICIVITLLLDGEIRKLMLVSLGVLFLSTILYEVARNKKMTNLIFIFVGVGYPLRFFIGFFSVKWVFNFQVLCFILALWAYGSFASILSWVNEVTIRMQNVEKQCGSFPISYEKKHFEYIQDIIKDRYEKSKECSVIGNYMPMSEKGRLKDPWNFAMMLCLAFLFSIVWSKKVPLILMILEFVVCIVFFINIYLRYKKKITIMIAGYICIIVKMLMGLLIYKISLWYHLFSIIQLVITITYFILSYQLKPKKTDCKLSFHNLTYQIKIKLLGEYAVNIIEDEKKKYKEK